MSDAIWMLLYDVMPENKTKYLSWFHKTHIPEKLDRPGYNWAGHYKNGTRYAAFFGGTNSRVFFDPSPTQLKLQQDDLTRQMVALRNKPLSLIFCHEWSCEGTAITKRPGHACEIFIGDAEQDETYNTWLAQNFLPAFSIANGGVRARKLLCTSGPVRHGLLAQFDTLESLKAFNIACPCPLSGTLYSPLAAKRLWPESS